MGTELYAPSSNSIIHNTKVDFTNRSIQKTINLVQYDRNMPIIAVSLYKNGLIYSLPVGMTVKIRWGKQDRTFVYKEALGCNTERNIIFFDVDEQMTYFHGKLDPIIELVDSSGSTPTIAGSSSIPVSIERNPIQESYIQSTSEYVDLVKAVEDAQQAAQYAEEIVAGGIPDLNASKITAGIFDAARIPDLEPTKITQNASNRFVTDVEKAYWDEKQDKLVAGDNITIDENTNVISATGGIETVDWQDVENKPDLNLKLDKNFSTLPAQANPLLTDVLVLNRGVTVQKVILGNLLSQFNNDIFEVVSILPTTGVVNKIYLVPSSEPETQNTSDEFIWVDDAWEKIGSVSVDLSNYFNKTEINSILDDKVDKVSGKGLSKNDFTDEYKNKVDDVIDDVSQLQTGKQDKLVAGLNISIVGNTISASSGGGEGTQDITAAEVKALYEANEDTNAFTDDAKDKLSGIQAGAEANVQSDWTQGVNTADDYIKNKPAIPTKVSDLTNDSGFITTETDPIFTAWNKSTGISITKSQVSDLIAATQSLPGLMSATDKQRLDVLHALLEEDTENNVVDTINEVLSIFNNYPEGADLVTALAGKVNKADIVDNLTSTDTNKPLSAKQGKVLNDALGNIDAILDSILGV